MIVVEFQIIYLSLIHVKNYQYYLYLNLTSIIKILIHLFSHLQYVYLDLNIQLFEIYVFAIYQYINKINYNLLLHSLSYESYLIIKKNHCNNLQT